MKLSTISLCLIFPVSLLALALGAISFAKPHSSRTVYAQVGATPLEVAKAHIVDSANANQIGINSLRCKTTAVSENHAVVVCKVGTTAGPASLTIDEVKSLWHLTSSSDQ